MDAINDFETNLLRNVRTELIKDDIYLIVDSTRIKIIAEEMRKNVL